MQKKPRVSFVCSVKNGAQQIKRCTSSVLNQSIEDVELIFVDDQSSDETWAAMESIAREDDRVRAVRNYGRGGLTYSLNIGIDFARGEYIARIDVDDFAHRDRAEKQVSALESNPSAVMVSGAFRVADENDWYMYSHCPPGDPKMLRWSLCFRNYIRHSTAMWRKSLDVRYDPSFPQAQDYDLWSRISKIGDIITIGDFVATITNRRDSLTNTHKAEQESAADRVVASRWELYTGSRIDQQEARHLRLIQHMKSAEQFEAFNNMEDSDFSKAVKNYCVLACRFSEKETPDNDQMMSEIGNDIMSLLRNGAKNKQTIEALASYSDICRGSKTMEEITNRFVPE